MRAALWAACLCLLPGFVGAQMAPAADTTGHPTREAVLFVDLIARDSVPPEYRVWYHDAEVCTGLKGIYEAVRWYTTPHPWKDGLHGDSLTYGMWQNGHRITLNLPERLDSDLVMHESIHDLLAWHPEFPDTATHPLALYNGRCASVHHR